MFKILNSLVCCLLVAATASAQWRLYPVEQTGIKVLMPLDPQRFEITQLDNGSQLYIQEVQYENYIYGAIAVVFKTPLAATTTEAEKYAALESHLNLFQNVMEIQHTVGYGRGHTRDGYPDMVGVVDYWEDKDELQIQLKGWINSKYIVVLYTRGYDTNAKGWEAFLQGFSLPK